MRSFKAQGRANVQRDVLEQRLEKFEAVLIIGFAANEMLEHTKQRRQLVAIDDALTSTTQERPQQSNQGRNVSLLLPQRRREQWWQQRLVGVGEVVRGVQFEKLREDLEDERRELGDVLLKDRLERREEGRFESGEGRGVASGDEAAKVDVSYKSD